MVSTRKRSLIVKAAKAVATKTPVKKSKTTTATTATTTTTTTNPVSPLVEELLQKSGIGHTTTKGGWCLKEGMAHVLEADASGQLLSIVQQKGLPAVYSIVEDAACRHRDDSATTTNNGANTSNKPQNCFQSLCRIIAGQQLAGSAARAMWHRLVRVVETSTDEAQLTPNAILALAEQGFESQLQKPAGLSRAKARAIVALAEAFDRGNLTESFLTASSSTEEEIRSKLLPIKGIGPWTCDMFLMFYLEKENVLPVGDLGVRKGIAKYFGLKGRGPKGSLCQVKDKEVMEDIMKPFRPYQSLVTYYMWKVADTKDFYRDGGAGASTGNNDVAGRQPVVTSSTPSKDSTAARRGAAVVTP